jgi:hypothetical protein
MTKPKKKPNNWLMKEIHPKGSLPKSAGSVVSFCYLCKKQHAWEHPCREMYEAGLAS